MTKPVIVTRASNGSALTWTQGDANITNLRDATIAIKAGAGGTDVVSDLNGTVTLVAGTNVTLTGDNTAKTVTITAAGGSGITDVVQDTSPQLGGDLDVNGRSIVSASNGNINITPNGSGNISLSPATGKIILGAADWPTTTGSAGQVLTTSGGTGVLSWADAGGGGLANIVEDLSPQLGGDLDVNGRSIVSASNGNINITPNGSGNISLSPATGKIILGSSDWPATSGSAGQVLTTSGGTGVLSWETVSSGITVTDDTTTNATRYLTFEDVTTGTSSIVNVSSTKLTFNPSTGRLTSTELTGSLRAYNEGAIYNIGTAGGTQAPNVANGNVQKITLSSALTLNAFTSPVAGQSLTLIIYGGTAYTAITSTMKFAGGVKTLTATAGCIDIVSIYYDGTTYFASLGKGFA